MEGMCTPPGWHQIHSMSQLHGTPILVAHKESFHIALLKLCNWVVQIKALLTCLSCKGQGSKTLQQQNIAAIIVALQKEHRSVFVIGVDTHQTSSNLDPSFGRLETRPPNQLCSTAALDPSHGQCRKTM